MAIKKHVPVYSSYWNAPDNRKVTIKSHSVFRNGKSIQYLTAVYAVKIGYPLITPVCTKWIELKKWLKDCGYYWNSKQVHEVLSTQDIIEEISAEQTLVQQALETFIKKGINEYAVTEI